MVHQVEQIAARVREMRDIMDISVESIAEKIGVDVETYINYENASSDIPIGKLYLIADALEVDPTVLLIGDQPRMADYTVVRGGRGIEVERYSGYNFVSLAHNYVGRDMEPMIVKLSPDGKQADLVTHEGQEFNYVIEGTVAVTINNKECILNAGDSIYFNPKLPHGQRAVGDAPAKFLTVINE